MEPNTSTQPTQPVTQPIIPPAPEQPAQPKPKLSKRIILGVILIILLMLATLGGVYFLNQKTMPVKTNTTAETLKPTPTPDPTTSWKTYTNDKFYITFKYPVDWTWNDSSPNDNNYGIFNNGFMQIGIIPAKLEFNKDISVNDFYNISAYNATWSKNESESGNTQTSLKIITFGSQKAIEQISHPTENYQAANINDSIYNYYFWQNDNIINLNFYINTDYKNKDALLKTKDQILSTFKFTDQNPTTSLTPQPLPTVRLR